MMCARMSLLALCLASGTALGAITVDGQRTPAGDTEYGAAKWSQSTATSRGDNNLSTPVNCGAGNGIRLAVDNSNTLGVTGGNGASDLMAVQLVATGSEFAIPFSQLGNPTGPIRIAGFVNGSSNDFISNQIIGTDVSLAPFNNVGNNGCGGNIGCVDFNTIAGDQWIEVPNSNDMTVVTAPAINGIIEKGTGEFYESTLRWVNPIQTQFGDSASGTIVGALGGSEINAVYTRVAVANLGDGAQKYLFLGVTGNLESNCNHLMVFFDIDQGGPLGQSTLRTDNANFDGEFQIGGFKLDTTFTADYIANLRGCGGPYRLFFDYGSLPTLGGGSFTNSQSDDVSEPRSITVNVACPTIPDSWIAGGSEINEVYSYLDSANNTLHVLITGNLRSFEEDKLHLFLDAAPGGQNALLSPDSNGNPRAVQVSNAEGGGGALRRMGPTMVGNPGLVLDIAADYYLNFHYEDFGSRRNSADAAVLRTNGFRTELDSPFPPVAATAPYDYGVYKCASGAVNAPPTIDFNGTSMCAFNVNTASGIQYQPGTLQTLNSHYPPRQSNRLLEALSAAFNGGATDQASFEAGLTGANTPVAGELVVVLDNRNVGGVTDLSGAGAASATHGVELAIDLDELGWDGVSDIRLAGFISNGDVTTVYNQYFGVQSGSADLGDPRNIDFSAIAGDQFVTLYSVPTGPTPCEIADFDNMNGVDVVDLFAFLDAWFAETGVCVSNCSSDISAPAGSPDVTDLFDYLDLWFFWQGTNPCP